MRPHVRILDVATAILGQPAKVVGGRSWWCCPIHDDHNPSFCVDALGWRCWSCGERGDAADLVMAVDACTFPEAVQKLAVGAGLVRGTSGPARQLKPPPAPTAATEAGPKWTVLDRAAAEQIVEDAARALWAPRGREALRHLETARGLSDDTIRRFRLGYIAGLDVPKRAGGTFPLGRAVLVPWFAGDRLIKLLARRLGPGGKQAKAIAVFTDGPQVFPSTDAIHPRRPLAIVEGEWDALLLGQELRGFASVLTIGGSSVAPGDGLKLKSLTAFPRFAAHDADDAGDRAAARWIGAKRVRPPAGKDWCEARQRGIDLRSWWAENCLPALEEAIERAAIMEHDGGLSRAEADRLAGLTEGLTHE